MSGSQAHVVPMVDGRFEVSMRLLEAPSEFKAPTAVHMRAQGICERWISVTCAPEPPPASPPPPSPPPPPPRPPPPPVQTEATIRQATARPPPPPLPEAWSFGGLRPVLVGVVLVTVALVTAGRFMWRGLPSAAQLSARRGAMKLAMADDDDDAEPSAMADGGTHLGELEDGHDFELEDPHERSSTRAAQHRQAPPPMALALDD